MRGGGEGQESVSHVQSETEGEGERKKEEDGKRGMRERMMIRGRKRDAGYERERRTRM